jgi:hypothetical protein
MKSFIELNMAQRYQNKTFLKAEITFVLRINPPQRMLKISQILVNLRVRISKNIKKILIGKYNNN